MSQMFAKPPEWHERRKGKVTGSKAGAIMRGGADAYELFLIETGQAQPEDLTWKIPVLMGSALEGVILALYEHDTGREVSRRNEWSESARYPFMACEIDGFDAETNAVLDAKFTLGFGSEVDHWQRYIPQLTHNAVVTGAANVGLIVLTGKGEFRWIEDAVDPFFAAELIEREEAFAEMVKMGQWLGDFTPAAPPPAPETWREIDFTGNNAWAVQAGIWLETKPLVDKFEAACVALKGDKKKKIDGLIPADCGKATGHGIIATRAKTGAVTIKKDPAHADQ